MHFPFLFTINFANWCPPLLSHAYLLVGFLAKLCYKLRLSRATLLRMLPAALPLVQQPLVMMMPPIKSKVFQPPLLSAN